jgi:transcriptional regulator with XRE-family HTH domain
MELYKKLQYIRKIRGMTQQDIADSFNISRQAIQKWGNGESAPDISKLYDLSIIYNISLDVLLDDSLTENHLTSLVLSKNHINNQTSIHLLNIITNPEKTDLLILGIVATSTSLIVITLHIIGVILVILVLALLISFIIGSCYFLINAFMNIDVGFSSVISNIGFSFFSVGIFYFIYSNMRMLISHYIVFTKRVAQRIKIYLDLLKGLQNEKKL